MLWKSQGKQDVKFEELALRRAKAGLADGSFTFLYGIMQRERAEAYRVLLSEKSSLDVLRFYQGVEHAMTVLTEELRMLDECDIEQKIEEENERVEKEEADSIPRDYQGGMVHYEEV